MREIIFLLYAGLSLLVSAAVFLALLAAILFSHDACVTGSGEVRYGNWELNPLAWLGKATVSEEQVCESETGTMFLAGKLPVVGETLERLMGGSTIDGYYKNK